MRNFLRNNGLSIVLLLLFAMLLVGQAVTGFYRYNDEQRQHGQPPVDFQGYLGTGHFLEATAENWESEFLQMAAYVLLTVFLYQKGSSESKTPGRSEPVDRDPARSRNKKDAPGPVRRGGWRLRLYANSLSLAFLLLFVISFVLHAIGGVREYNESQLEHGGATLTPLEYLATSQFWFESLQNWQSEFLAIAAMVILSIFLRQQGSPESKPVDAPHSQTGTE